MYDFKLLCCLVNLCQYLNKCFDPQVLEMVQKKCIPSAHLLSITYDKKKYMQRKYLVLDTTFFICLIFDLK